MSLSNLIQKQFSIIDRFAVLNRDPSLKLTTFHPTSQTIIKALSLCILIHKSSLKNFHSTILFRDPPIKFLTVQSYPKRPSAKICHFLIYVRVLSLKVFTFLYYSKIFSKIDHFLFLVKGPPLL